MFKDSEIHTKVDALHARVEQLNKQESDNHQRIEQLHEKLSADITQLQDMVGKFSVGFATEVQNIKIELSAVQQARADVEKSTRSFSEVQKKIERTVHDQLSTAIGESIQRLKLEAENYNALKSEFVKAGSSVQKLTEEIGKFTSISSQIKEADFELAKHAKVLNAADTEKVRLMKEVDDLQRLVGKMRRSSQGSLR